MKMKMAVNQNLPDRIYRAKFESNAGLARIFTL
jgi:hypothetical protein